MNRLQKKCFVASAGVHSLLALVLLIGPGFISSPKKQDDDLPILNFVPIKTVDELVSGGGNPKAKPPAAQPVQPQPQPPISPPPPQPEPQPEKVKEPDPPKQPEPTSKDEDLAPAKETKPRKPVINTTLITHKRETNTDKQSREEAQARAEARAAADARRRLARQLGQAADNLGNELSGGTSIELKGPGGGGVPYANWRQAIKTIYENAWLLPENVIDNDAVTEASVTIARDGTVITSRIIHLSGDSVVDRSVQAALDRVPRTPPLPETVKEDRRTITIKFSVSNKRALG